jgi:hypothetical protein
MWKPGPAVGGECVSILGEAQKMASWNKSWACFFLSIMSWLYLEVGLRIGSSDRSPIWALPVRELSLPGATELALFEKQPRGPEINLIFPVCVPLRGVVSFHRVVHRHLWDRSGADDYDNKSKLAK